VEIFEEDGEPGSARWVKRTQLRLRILLEHGRRIEFDERCRAAEGQGFSFDLPTRTLRPVVATPPSLSPAAQDARQPDDAVSGAVEAWALQAFDLINTRYFQGELPTAEIVWGLTPYGRCWGRTSPGGATPTILLHPALLGGRTSNPWGVDSAWLGPAFAFDVLLHECVHLSQHHRLGGVTGATSHNDRAWIAEVNRLIPWLGLRGEAGRSQTIRVPCAGPLTKRGKQPTKVVRRSQGDLPHRAIATFPYGLRIHLGRAEAYYRAGLPPAWGLPQA
jgi:hypothetical protein